MLLKVCPDLPICHRPDFAGFRKTHKTAPRSRTCISRAYLWPYMNLEDLQQNELLLLMFFNSRARHLPAYFIGADIENAHLGRGWEFCGHTGDSMVFYDQRTPRTYGAILGVEEGYEKQSHFAGAMNLVSRYEPHLGLLGMALQAGIYDFLLGCEYET